VICIEDHNRRLDRRPQQVPSPTTNAVVIFTCLG